MSTTRTKATKEQVALLTLLASALYSADPSGWRSLMGPSNKAREILDTPGMAQAMAAKVRGELATMLAAMEEQIAASRALLAVLERAAEAEATMEPEVVT